MYKCVQIGAGPVRRNDRYEFYSGLARQMEVRGHNLFATCMEDLQQWHN